MLEVLEVLEGKAVPLSTSSTLSTLSTSLWDNKMGSTPPDRARVLPLVLAFTLDSP